MSGSHQQLYLCRVMCQAGLLPRPLHHDRDQGAGDQVLVGCAGPRRSASASRPLIHGLHGWPSRCNRSCSGNRHERVDRSSREYRRGMKASASRSEASALRFASSEARGFVDPPVVVTAGPKHPLFFGGVYEPPRAARWIAGPAFARREVSWPRSAETRVSPEPRMLVLIDGARSITSLALAGSSGAASTNRSRRRRRSALRQKKGVDQKGDS